jgi:hypothetical protein
MPNINIFITVEEKNALLRLSEKELRDPKAQAYLIIRKELENQELLHEVQATQKEHVESI